MPEGVSLSARQPLRRWATKLAWLAVPLAVAGELGHLLLEWAREQLAHHLFHMTFGIGAGLIFFVFVIRDIRRNGWPEFTWRLQPDPSPTSDPRA